MTLPELTLPKIDLPFDIPVLIHPSIDHFAIVLPVIVLLLEFYNLFAKRKSIGVFSFILLILTVVAFAAAYFTGVVDGKEAYDLLPTEGQEELKFHKLLGTYLLLGSVALLFFKLLAMTGKKLLKVLFFIVLLGFIAVTFQQGKDGGELVYEYGANVERVKALDDKLFDAQDALEESQEESVSKSIDTTATDKAEEKISPSSEETMKNIETKSADVEKSVIIEKEDKNEALNMSDNSEVTEVESLAETVPEKKNLSSKDIDSENPEEENKNETLNPPRSTIDTVNNSSIAVEEEPMSEEKVQRLDTRVQEKSHMPDSTEPMHAAEVLSDTAASSQIPQLPTVPKAIEVNPAKEAAELPEYKESIDAISEDLEQLKIETH
ncbi:MAG: hypothetical protein L3J43_07110 [Sulfurovum sp.]|nr:hypothetical protein [Sulfurovum sp.]